VPKIFISYRREDTAEICGRIFDRLESRYGDHSVLKDVDSIPAGADFRAYLAQMVTQCDVMIVVIGPRWSGLDPYRPRLHDPNDFVRSEVELALRRGIPIIPVLVYGVDMPAPAALPPSLAPISYRNAIWVRGDPDFRRDMDRVIAGIDAMVAARAAAAPGDISPVDLSPQAQAQAQPPADSNASAFPATGASAADQAPSTSAYSPPGVAIPATPPGTVVSPGVPVPPLSPMPAPAPMPMAPPFAAPGGPGGQPMGGYGVPAPATAPRVPPVGPMGPGMPAGAGSSGTFDALGRAAAPSMPLGASAWAGVPPAAPPAHPTQPAHPARRPANWSLAIIAVAVVALIAVVASVAVVIGHTGSQKQQTGLTTAASQAATQTATAKHIYTAALPGPNCDTGDAQWRLSNATESCPPAGGGPGAQLTRGSDVSSIGTVDFYWFNAASLPADARVQVTISQLAKGSCAGVLLRKQSGLSGGSDGAYGFWICDDGSARILSYDDTTGAPTTLASSQEPLQATNVLVAEVKGDTLSLTLGSVPMSVKDTAYTTTRGISLGVDHLGTSKVPGSAVFSNFVFTAED
jgi:hypothetical protein